MTTTLLLFFCMLGSYTCIVSDTSNHVRTFTLNMLIKLSSLKLIRCSEKIRRKNENTKSRFYLYTCWLADLTSPLLFSYYLRLISFRTLQLKCNNFHWVAWSVLWLMIHRVPYYMSENANREVIIRQTSTDFCSVWIFSDTFILLNVKVNILRFPEIF